MGVVFSCRRIPTGDSEHAHQYTICWQMGLILIGDVAEFRLEMWLNFSILPYRLTLSA